MIWVVVNETFSCTTNFPLTASAFSSCSKQSIFICGHKTAKGFENVIFDLLSGICTAKSRANINRTLGALPASTMAVAELKAALLRLDRERNAIAAEIAFSKEQLGPLGTDAPLVDGANSRLIFFRRWF